MKNLSDQALLGVIFGARVQEKLSVPEVFIGKKTATTLPVNTHLRMRAIQECYQRFCYREMQKQDVRLDSAQVKRFLQSKLGAKEREVFAVLFLNACNELLAFEELFRGSVITATIYPREIVKRTLHYNATAVIFAHNHPHGSSKPSEEDIRLTKMLSRLLKKIEVTVLDHCIVSKESVVSMAEQGLY